MDAAVRQVMLGRERCMREGGWLPVRSKSDGPMEAGSRKQAGERRGRIVRNSAMERPSKPRKNGGALGQ